MARRAISLDLRGDKELLGKLGRVGSQAAGRALEVAIEAAAEVLQDRADVIAGQPVHGTDRPQLQRGVVSVRVGPTRENWKAALLQRGAGPHRIKPKNKKALFGAGYQHPIRKEVLHPGFEKRPALVDALGQVADKVQKRFTDVLLRESGIEE